MSDGEFFAVLLLIMLFCALLCFGAVSQVDPTIRLTDTDNVVVKEIDWGTITAGYSVNRTVFVESNRNCTLYVYGETHPAVELVNVTKSLQANTPTPIILTLKTLRGVADMNFTYNITFGKEKT